MAQRPEHPSPELTAALARLSLSRAQLRGHMIPPPAPPPPPGSASDWLPKRLRAWWRHLRRQRGGWPLAGVATAALGEWWRQHPWRPAGEVLADELKATAMPLFRRHPLWVMAGAAGLGAFLVSQRPWRWPGVAEHVRPMPRRLGRFLLSQLTQAPFQTALLSLFVLLRKPREDTAHDSPPAPASASPSADAADPVASGRQPNPTPTHEGG